MTSVGSHNTSGREKAGENERMGTGRNEDKGKKEKDHLIEEMTSITKPGTNILPASILMRK